MCIVDTSSSSEQLRAKDLAFDYDLVLTTFNRLSAEWESNYAQAMRLLHTGVKRGPAKGKSRGRGGAAGAGGGAAGQDGATTVLAAADAAGEGRLGSAKCNKLLSQVLGCAWLKCGPVWSIV